MNSPKEIALDFLALITEGQVDEAYERFIDLSGTHHNVHTAAGFEALRAGMKESDEKFPDKQFTVKRVVSEGEMVVVYSHLALEPGQTGLVVVHMFRFKNGKIIELWDCGQPIPEPAVNSDGAF